MVYVIFSGTSSDVSLPVEPVPEGLDWDLWLGPAPTRPFNGLYHRYGRPPHVVPWHFCRDFGGGESDQQHGPRIRRGAVGLGMDESGPVEVIPPETGKVPSLTYKYANGVPLQVVDGRLDPAKHLIPKGWDPPRGSRTSGPSLSAKTAGSTSAGGVSWRLFPKKSLSNRAPGPSLNVRWPIITRIGFSASVLVSGRRATWPWAAGRPSFPISAASPIGPAAHFSGTPSRKSSSAMRRRTGFDGGRSASRGESDTIPLSPKENDMMTREPTITRRTLLRRVAGAAVPMAAAPYVITSTAWAPKAGPRPASGLPWAR